MWVGGRHAPATFTTGKDPYPLYRCLGGPQGRPRDVRKNLAPSGIRSPDLPSRNELLYRLLYPGPLILAVPALNPIADRVL